MTLNEILALHDGEYIGEADLAAALGKTVSALRTARSRRRGPPASKCGKTIFYRVGALRGFLIGQEEDFEGLRRDSRKRQAA